jgi:predicted lysophospholipase L1 biosynthesis ABC-type transport system permease subunit
MSPSTALRLAWRDSRTAAAKFAFVILAVAVGVGSLTGVRGFSRAFRGMLLKDARTLMAADLTVRVFELPTPAQQQLFDSLSSRSIDRTWITETVSMLSAPAMSTPLLVAVKGVDPAKYPFYGSVDLADNSPSPPFSPAPPSPSPMTSSSAQALKPAIPSASAPPSSPSKPSSPMSPTACPAPSTSAPASC